MTKRIISYCAITAIALLLGCQTPNKKDGKLPKLIDNPLSKSEPEYLPPQRMAVVWSDAVYRSADKAPTRGFGGRIYFYDEDNNPVKVNGEFIVYGYDDTLDEMEEKKVPKRKFVYTEKQFAQHFSESELGPSYSVWIPWDEVGGDKRNIGLLPVFRTADRQIVRGEHTRNVLPGKTPMQSFDLPQHGVASRMQQEASATIRPISYRQGRQSHSVDGASNEIDALDPPAQSNTTTIQVPTSLSRQLQLPQATHNRMPSIPGTSMAGNMGATAQPNTTVTYGENPHNSVMPNLSTQYNSQQSRSRVFGAPGAIPNQRSAALMNRSAQNQVPAQPSITQPSPQPTHYGHPRSQAQATLSGPPDHVHAPY